MSPKTNWVTLSWSHDKRFDDLRVYLESKGIYASHKHMCGALRGFLTASGLSYDEPIAFAQGVYIGPLADVMTFVEECELAGLLDEEFGGCTSNVVVDGHA